MPISRIKRKARRIARRAKNWGRIANLTLSGNTIEKTADFKNCRKPTLMIYGFGATRRTLSIIENRLSQDGYTIFTLNLGGFFGTFNTLSIEEAAKLIDEKIEKIYKKYKIRGRLNIVGHSKGGLIGQYYIKFFGGKKRVKTFITLGTPHNGTPWCTLAKFTPLPWVCPSLKQMAPDSEFIQKLKDTKFPKKCMVYSIFSKDDTVCPYPVSVLEDGDNITNIEVFGVTHSELLIKKNVHHAIKYALKHEIPTSWGESSKRDYQKHLKEQGGRFKIIKGMKK
jgi:triacylglycerol lipase